MHARFKSWILIVVIALSVNGMASTRDARKNLMKSVDEKQTTAVHLINTVGTYNNGRFSNEEDKEDSEFAYNGFMARFESLREDREALERKEIIPDNATLEKYSKQYDRLISDLNAYLNNNEHY